MSIFLRMKHWQLFGLLFGLPFISAIGFMFNLFSQLLAKNVTLAAMELPLPFIATIALYLLCLYAWWWSLGSFAVGRLPDTMKKSQWFFRASMLYPLFYTGLFYWFIFFVFLRQDIETLHSLFFIIFPFHVLAMFCNIYCVYFIAKTLKQTELQRRVKFDDYVAELFLLLFFVVGVWILQPRINKLYEESQVAQP